MFLREQPSFYLNHVSAWDGAAVQLPRTRTPRQWLRCHSVAQRVVRGDKANVEGAGDERHPDRGMFLPVKHHEDTPLVLKHEATQLAEDSVAAFHLRDTGVTILVLQLHHTGTWEPVRFKHVPRRLRGGDGGSAAQGLKQFRCVAVSIMVESYTAPLVHRETVAENTVEIGLDTSSTSFGFEAGQFVMITVPALRYEDGRGDTRSFSLASPPEKDVVTTAYRVSDSGYKQTLQELETGTELTVQGPFGQFTLPEDTETPLVFLAGGIGVTPFRSMLHHSLNQDTGHEIRLVYGNRNRDRAAYLDEFQAAADTYDRVAVNPVFGDITKQDIRDAAANPSSVNWFVAGPPQMVRDMRHILIAEDVPGTQIHTEAFSGY